MLRPSVFISVVPFGKIDPTPINILKATGWDIRFNSKGRRLTPEEIIEEAKGCHALIVSTESLDRVVDECQNLQFISRVGIGLDSVPLKKCRDRNIIVHYTPDAVTSAVGELTLGSMIVLTRHLPQSDHQMRQGIWKRSIGKSIHASTIGIIGCGRTGKYVIRLLSAFSPQKILVNDLPPKNEEIQALAQANPLVVPASKEEIYQSADIISLHLPLNRHNHFFIAKKELRSMSSKTFLINYARGGLIKEDDLYYALSQGLIAGAALDVFEKEPYTGPLSSLGNVWLSSHMGACSSEARRMMETEATQAVINFYTGKSLLSPVPENEYENE